MDSDLGLANVSHAGDIFETPALPVRAADWLALLSWPAGYVHSTMLVEVEIQHILHGLVWYARPATNPCLQRHRDELVQVPNFSSSPISCLTFIGLNSATL